MFEPLSSLLYILTHILDSYFLSHMQQHCPAHLQAWECLKERFQENKENTLSTKKKRKIQEKEKENMLMTKKKSKKTRSRPCYRPRKKAGFKILLFSFINSHLMFLSFLPCLEDQSSIV